MHSPYMAMGNNPMMYVDPDGEWFLLAAGIIMGGIQGGLQAESQGDDFWSGAWKGALIGGIGGGLSMIGDPASFALNLGTGIGEGAALGALDAVLWGNDPLQAALYGGIGGGITTTLTSPNMRNWTKGNGFKNNQKVFDNFMANSTPKQEILDYFGFEGTYVVDEFDNNGSFLLIKKQENLE